MVETLPATDAAAGPAKLIRFKDILTTGLIWPNISVNLEIVYITVYFHDALIFDARYPGRGIEAACVGFLK